MTSLVFTREPHAALLAALPGPYVCVKTRSEFLAATQRGATIAFVEVELLSQVEGETSNVPIVAIADNLPQSVEVLDQYPWLSHLVTATMLATPLASTHLKMFLDRIVNGPEHGFLGATAVGRVALLASSTRRELRFERMREFFSTNGFADRAVSSIADVAEELVMNALYDAPVEAGYFKAPVMRVDDVDLPPEVACEISYGIDQGNAFVRVRDPFGAFTRTRLLHVLNRCNTQNVSLDESRGGAGLGLWRVFSVASTIAITVLPNRLTDVLVRIEPKKARGKQTLAVHLFLPEDQSLDGSQGRFAADHDYDLMDDSFTAIQTPGPGDQHKPGGSLNTLLMI